MGIAQPRSLLKRGVLGGRFDPFHAGHLQLIHWCLSHQLVDCIDIVPVAHPVHKPVSLPYATRRQHIAKAIEGLGDRVSINDIETLREGPSWMIDTILALQQHHPEDTLCIIMGSDTLMDFHRWYQSKRLQSLVQLIVFNRPSHPLSSVQSWALDTLSCPIEWVNSHWDISSTDQRPRTRWVIGLTGRMGTGKTTAATYLHAQYGIPVLSLDTLGHKCLASPLIQAELGAIFGPLQYTPCGDIDRQWLGKRVFSSPEDLAVLNRTVHPMLRHRCVEALTQHPTGIVVIEGALLHAIGLAAVCDEVWVLDATDQTIRDRIGDRADRLWAQPTQSTYQEWGRVIHTPSIGALHAQLTQWITPLLHRWPLPKNAT